MSKNNVKEINEHLFFELPNVKTDCLLLLGARSASGEIARAALKLYKDGKSKKIIISGGLKLRQLMTVFAAAVDKNIQIDKKEALSSKTEAEFMRDYLLENGVESDDIIFLENKSSNTGQNFKYSLQVLERMNSINIVCLAYAQRRALGTARKYLGDRVILTTTAVSPFNVNEQNWHLTKLSSVVYGEMKKIDPSNPKNYIQLGFCKYVDLDKERSIISSPVNKPPKINAPRR